MYHSYFGLREAPFSIAPDPQYLYMSTRHQEALAHLMYGIHSDGGFILLTGEVGTGKTTICRRLLAELPDNLDTAFIVNPKQTADELIASICDDLDIHYPAQASTKVLVDRLNAHLLGKLDSDRRTLVIIDEAQNLSIEVLEQLRLLTNLETDKRKLLQIILLGQPELLDLLAQPALRQLSQRITARFHLDALTRPEVNAYIAFRLSVAGAPHNLFSRAAISRAFKLSRGIPRLINLICDRALLGAFGQGRQRVTRRLVDRAASEVLAPRRAHRNGTSGSHPATVAALTLAAVITTMVAIGTYSGKLQPLVAAITVLQPGPTPADEPGQRNLAPASARHQLSSVMGHISQRNAFNDLFALWGLYLDDPDADPCETITRIGLACFAANGGADEVRSLNRPVLLQLPTNGQWVTLSALDGNLATLIASDRQYEVDFDQLIHSLRGQMTLLWRMPPGYRGPIRPGDRGEDVDWLARQLAIMDNQPEPSKRGQPYDNEMLARVRAFQNEVKLPADGVAGPRTWVHLNSIEGGNIPYLTRAGDH
jgi:general secretion pathway protein A